MNKKNTRAVLACGLRSLGVPCGTGTPTSGCRQGSPSAAYASSTPALSSWTVVQGQPTVPPRFSSWAVRAHPSKVLSTTSRHRNVSTPACTKPPYAVLPQLSVDTARRRRPPHRLHGRAGHKPTFTQGSITEITIVVVRWRYAVLQHLMCNAVIQRNRQ